MKNNSDKMETGSYKDFPQHSVIGRPTDFYVWMCQSNGPGSGRYVSGVSGASNWIRGRQAFEYYHQLKRLLEDNKKKEFNEMVRNLHIQYKRMGV